MLGDAALCKTSIVVLGFASDYLLHIDEAVVSLGHVVSSHTPLDRLQLFVLNLVNGLQYVRYLRYLHILALHSGQQLFNSLRQ